VTEKIDLKLERLAAGWGIHCTACGYFTENAGVMAVGEAGGHDVAICPSCLFDGDIDLKVKQHAARLDGRGIVMNLYADPPEDMAIWLRTLIGRLNPPTYGEWAAEWAARAIETGGAFPLSVEKLADGRWAITGFETALDVKALFKQLQQQIETGLRLLRDTGEHC
jgi:hypothetical protein